MPNVFLSKNLVYHFEKCIIDINSFKIRNIKHSLQISYLCKIDCELKDINLGNITNVNYKRKSVIMNSSAIMLLKLKYFFSLFFDDNVYKEASKIF